MRSKRGLVISDLHSGHISGFTPPSFDYKSEKDTEIYKVRRLIYRWTMREAKKRGPYDFMIVNGDMIDGRGEKSGGTELLATDRVRQCKMAAEAIMSFNVPKIYFAYGTGYHTGAKEDFEDVIVEIINGRKDFNGKVVKIGGEDNLDVNGCIINYRHYIGRSSIPHGRHTAVAKERLWNQLWAHRGEYPMAQIIIRSHVHYHAYAGGPGWVAMTTPALQNYGGKYGSRIMSGTVDIGFVVLNIDNRSTWSWEAPILRMPLHEPLSL